MRYAVIYEKTGTGYSAYAPDLPGCIATGRTLDLTKKRMAEAMEMHLAAMHRDHDPILDPVTETGYIEVLGLAPARAHDRQRRPALSEKTSTLASRK
jgi:predicted RNase H-like HicB family nuclease